MIFYKEITFCLQLKLNYPDTMTWSDLVDSLQEHVREKKKKAHITELINSFELVYN